MAASKYTFNITTDFPNQKVNTDRLMDEIRSSVITIALDYINTTTTDCDIWFKDELSLLDSTSTLPTLIANHSGAALDVVSAPTMPDGRPIMRSDSRPLYTSTVFTMQGDDSTSIGNGVELIWDFSNDDDLYDGPEVPSGFKCKQMLISFATEVHLKDGMLFFFDAPWGSYVTMDVAVPPNNFYPNPTGPYTSAMLGLSGTLNYAHSGNEIITFQRFVNKYRITGTCNIGTALDAEGCTTKPMPIGWYLCGRVYTPISDNVSKGYASMEMYRSFSILRPGMKIEDLGTYQVDTEEI